MSTPKEWVPLFLLSIPIICAVLAARGFRGREHVIGVDLGTTYSVIGIRHGDNITIIPDSYGNLLTPSAVAFLPEGKILVGREAIDYKSFDPKHTIFNAKRFIGRSWDDIIVQQEAKLYDFEVTYNETNDVCFKISVDGHLKCIGPVEIGSHVVKQLKKITSEHLGHNQVTTAVIAVPAAFNAVQRAATAKAFQMAGLKVLRILDEPSCAAIAYGLHEKKGVDFVLVFDFGGGTLDVSLLYIKEGAVEVVGTAGDNHLGGEDFDFILSKELMLKFKKLSGFPNESNYELKEKRKDEILPCTSSGIRSIAEKLKRNLSENTIATAACAYENQIFQVQMTRKELEKLCESLLDRILKPVYKVLQETHMTPKNVDAVVLVGGSSRIPWVRQRLEEVFERELYLHIDPDIAIAYGASAIQ